MQITLCFPLAITDKAHASHQLRLLKEFGPYLEDRALIMPTPAAYHDPELRAVVDGIAALFAPENVDIEVMPNDFQSGTANNWPYGPNCHFRMTVELLDIKGIETPWIFFEPDLYPIRKDWLRLVKEDYLKGGTAFRGMVEPTRWVDTNLKTKERTQRYDGYDHFVGAGMYPAKYMQYLCPVGNAPMATFRAPNRVIPFDVKAQHEHKPASQSPLWLHRPRTKNWSTTMALGGVPTHLSCEDVAKDEFGLSYAGTYDVTQVCLIHGPKDGSLADAILKLTPYNLNLEMVRPSEPFSNGYMSPIGPEELALRESEAALVKQFSEITLAPEPSLETPMEARLFLLQEENDRLIDELEKLTKENRQLTEKLVALHEESTKPPALKKPGRPKKLVPA
jgi:hypothetical protein